MTTGIYKIENMITHQVYIGQSLQIEVKWQQHKKPCLRFNDKLSTYYYKIYTAMREYGIENFQFSIIEECLPTELNNREKYWIKYYDSYVNGYNMTTGGDSYGRDIDKLFKIYQYDLEGNYIQGYPCVRAAAEALNGEVSNLYIALSLHHSAYGYQWSYIKLDKMDPYIGNYIPVIAFTTDTGEKVKTFLSLNKAIFETGDTYKAIKRSCDTHQYSGNYQWRYWIENPSLEKIPPYKWNNKIAVDQYDLNGVYINTYESLATAANILNLSSANLSTCLNGKQKSHGGFLWCRHDEELLQEYKDNRIGHTTSTNKRMVQQYSKDNNFIQEYESAHEAARQINKPKCANHITECCQKKRKSCEGYIWKYKEE